MKFFDFRIADLAMGSGHFLVASIDRALQQSRLAPKRGFHFSARRLA